MKTAKIFFFSIALLLAGNSRSQIISYWHFNSATPDNNTSTGETSAIIGSGSSSILGGATSTFASGTANGGSSDTTSTDNSGINLTGFPAQGTNEKTAGIRFDVSTVGYSDVLVFFDIRHSNTSSRFVKLQYSIDGTNFIDFDGAGTDTAGVYQASLGGDTWYKRKKADLRGIAGVANNANFAFRIVTAFAPGTSNYVAARTTSSYATTGTLRFDAVGVENLYSLQILHASDHEGGLEAVKDAPGFAAVIDTLEHTYANSLTLFSGDLFIPSPFLSASEDPALQAPLRNTASAYYAGTTSGLRASIGRVDIAIMNILGVRASVLGNHEFDLGTSELNGMIGVDIRSGGTDKRWIGAQFPYLSANLDFSNDANLNYLYTSQILADTAFRTPANITSNAGKKGLAPSTIIYLNGEKIGVVGVTTPILAQISSPGATTVKGPGNGTDNMVQLASIIQPYIDSLRIKEGVNKIVVLSHLQQIHLEEALLPLLHGVDIMIAGGSHTLAADLGDALRPGDTRVREYPIITKNADNEDAVILNTDANYKYVGRFVANFDNAGILLLEKLDSNINGAYRTDSTGVAALYGNYSNAFLTGSKGALVKTLCDSIGSVIIRKDGALFGKTSVFLEGRRNFVRTEETNLGNISSDANLAAAKIADPAVRVSIKNGGGIRSAIGEVYAVGSTVTLLPPAPNASAGKQRGDISQLDIENSLRFNNRLSILELTATGLKAVLEHGVSASASGATPGQFPQVSGVRFSYDLSKPANSRIWSAVITDTLENTIDTLVFRGAVYGNPNRVIKIVTLNFLAGGGDNYPFATLGSNRRDLDTIPAIVNAPGVANFTVPGSEQDAFAEYTASRFGTTPYNKADTSFLYDQRIQQVQAGKDGIFPPLGTFSLANPANNTTLQVAASNPGSITINWTKSASALSYAWKLDSPGNSFTTPLLVLPANNAGADTALTLPIATVDQFLAQISIPLGGSASTIWTVYAYDGTDSVRATEVFNLTLTRSLPLPGSFSLTSPANNSRVLTLPNSNAPVVIDWTDASNAQSYLWQMDELAGDFSTPVLTLPGDNAGATSQISTTLGTLDQILAAQGIQAGDSIQGIWRVRATNATGSTNSTQTYTITLVRGNPSFLKQTENAEVRVYPNPTRSALNLDHAFTGAVQIQVIDARGLVVLDKEAQENNTSIDMSAFEQGLYLVRIIQNGTVATTKVIKE